MYYTHFGLAQPPFRITPNTEFFYGGGNRGPILEALMYAISQGEGIIKVTGEVGSGKTMLCSMMQARLPANIESVYLANPSVSPEEILHAIALELHLKPPRDASHLEVMQMLNNHLMERHAAGKQVVMFVEESQSMPIATLEEIRLLSNLETSQSKLLQIVLFGQPELEENLRQPQIRQLRERITHSFRLSPLKPDEIRDYLNFRLRAAGYRGPDLFSPPIVAAIAKSSDGLTRRINLIADKALLAAFSENTHTIRIKHIKAAVRDSEFSYYEPPRPRLKFGLAVLLFMVGAGLGIALYALFTAYLNDAAMPQAPVVAVPPPPPPAQPAPPAAEPVAEAAAPTAQSATSPANDAKRPAETVTPSAPAAPAAPPPPAAPPAVAAKVAEPKPQVELSKPALKPEISVAGANSQVPVNTADEIELRMAATKEWLAQKGKNPYSIQLLGTDNPAQLKNHLNVIRKYVEINDIFVYRTIAKQKPSLTVLYGSFKDRRSAQEALAKLPASLKTYKPVLRTLQGVRAEIAQHQSS
ncbi:MAG: AAA family ATPase [Betaproteobacteria bacterium]|nr:AAA family ATPase [Betaproteobacteria bacterium]